MRTKFFRYLVRLELRRLGLSIEQLPDAHGGEATWIVRNEKGRSARVRVKIISYRAQRKGKTDPVPFSPKDFARHDESRISTLILCVDSRAKIGSTPTKLLSAAHGGVYRSLFLISPAQMDWLCSNKITSGQIDEDRLLLGSHFMMSLDVSVDTPFASVAVLLGQHMTPPHNPNLGPLDA